MAAFYHLLLWAFLVLTVLTALIGLTEWLIGPRGRKAVCDRLADFYVLLMEGDWSTVLQSAAATTDGFLSAMLGRELISFRSFFGWGVISVPFSIVTLAIYVQNNNPETALDWLSFVLGSFVVDYVFLVIARVMLRRLAHESNVGRGVVYVLYAFVACYVAVALLIVTTSLAEPAGIRYYVMSALEWPLAFSHWKGPVAMRLMLLLPVNLSTLIFFGVITVTTMLKKSRRMRRVGAMLVERLAESPRGVFSGIAAFMTATAGVIAALQKVAA
jgi:hypothetical protein